MSVEDLDKSEGLRDRCVFMLELEYLYVPAYARPSHRLAGMEVLAPPPSAWLIQYSLDHIESPPQDPILNSVYFPINHSC